MNTPLTRRDFMALFGLAASTIACLGARAAQSGSKVVVGAHPWVYAAKLPGYDITPVLADIFADMRYAGLDGIELMHTVLRPPHAVERIAALSEKNKLPIIGTSFEGAMWDRSQHNAVLEDAERVISRLAQLGGRTFGTSVGHAPAKKTEAQLDAQAECLKKVIALCEQHKVTLNLHNHTYEVVDGMHDLKGTLARIPDVKLGPDLNWLVRGGVNPVKFIQEYSNKINFLHLRDQLANGRWSEALGEGAMDFKAIAAALNAIPFQGHAIIELAHESDFQPTRPLRESLKQSREFVRKTFGW